MAKAPRILDEELIARIEAFIKETPGMTASSFGTKAVNDPGLIADLKSGREVRRSTRERIEAILGGFSETAPLQLKASHTASTCSNQSLQRSLEGSRATKIEAVSK